MRTNQNNVAVNPLMAEMLELAPFLPGIDIMSSTNHFFALNKNEQDKLRESTHIQINDKELLAARQYIALVALTGGQQEVTNEGYQNGRFQSYIYQQQGIFPEGIEDTINNLGQNLNLQQKINEIARSITADNINAFYKRLIEKRPLMFCDREDKTRLRKDVEADGFVSGASQSPGDYNLAEYINYSEMMFSGLLQVSGDAHFINDGRRDNCGAVYNSTNRDTGKAHQEQGSITAMVGARFEIYDGPDAIHFIPGVFQTLCSQPGFGSQESRGNLGRITNVTKDFADGFKGIGNQLFRNDYSNDVRHGFTETGKYLHLDIAALQTRLNMTYTKYLKHCVSDEELTGDKKAYIRIAGIGDGVWSGDNSCTPEIQKAIGKAVANAYSSLKMSEKAKISVIEFSEQPIIDQYGMRRTYLDAFGTVYNYEQQKFVSSQYCFAEKVHDKNVKLFVNVACDGGSYFGNELYGGGGTLSAEPAAALSGTGIATITPDFNPGLTQTIYVLNPQNNYVLCQEFLGVQPPVNSTTNANDVRQPSTTTSTTNVMYQAGHPSYESSQPKARNHNYQPQTNSTQPPANYVRQPSTTNVTYQAGNPNYGSSQPTARNYSSQPQTNSTQPRDLMQENENFIKVEENRDAYPLIYSANDVHEQEAREKLSEPINHFTKLTKQEQERFKGSVKIQITESELEATRKFIALVALTGGQQDLKDILQSNIYYQQGILPNTNYFRSSVATAAKNWNSVSDQVNAIYPLIDARNINAFYKRLITKKPLAFYGEEDNFILRAETRRRFADGLGNVREECPSGLKNTLNGVGKGCPGDLLLEEYINYSEIFFSSLLSKSCDTYFLNKGYQTHHDQGENDFQLEGRISVMSNVKGSFAQRIALVPSVEEMCYTSNYQGNFDKITGVTPEFVSGFLSIARQLFPNIQGPQDYMVQRLAINYQKYFADCVRDAQYIGFPAYIRFSNSDNFGNSDDHKVAIASAISLAYYSLSPYQQDFIDTIQISESEQRTIYNNLYNNLNPSLQNKTVSNGLCFAERLSDNKGFCKLYVSVLQNPNAYPGNEAFNGILSDDNQLALSTGVLPITTREFNKNLDLICLEVLKGNEYFLLREPSTSIQSSNSQQLASRQLRR